MEYWFIPDMISMIANGAITISEYIEFIQNCDIYTVFPADTIMEVTVGENTQIMKAQEKLMLKLLSETKESITFRFISKKKGINYVVNYDIPV